ncbi:MAG TPA: BsuPI-related putative proteinase inhibitor [Longimicrobium sp.]|nr:BsuPI-related putative proteinase inhibitor [Longimicrobium sp.]
MTVRRISIFCVLATLAMGGCSRDRSPPARPAGDAAAAAPAGPLALLLDVPATVRAGEEVPVAVTLVNRGAAPASVAGVQPDLVVTRADGGEVWRRSRHEPATQTASTTLRPQEMRGSGYAWNQRDDAGRPVSAGAYRIRAEAPSLKLTSEARALTIVP